MNSLPPTLTASQLAHTLERIEALAKLRAADDVTARKIWNECRQLRAEAEAESERECATMAVA